MSKIYCGKQKGDLKFYKSNKHRRLETLVHTITLDIGQKGQNVKTNTVLLLGSCSFGSEKMIIYHFSMNFQVKCPEAKRPLDLQWWRPIQPGHLCRTPNEVKLGTAIKRPSWRCGMGTRYTRYPQVKAPDLRLAQNPTATNAGTPSLPWWTPSSSLSKRPNRRVAKHFHPQSNICWLVLTWPTAM